MTDIRDDYIARTVKGGKSFADIGGLWPDARAEKVSVAYRAGAGSFRMIDVATDGDAGWKAFDEKMRALGILELVDRVGGDVQEYAEQYGEQSQVVHCSGVIYHAPEPTRFLLALRQITAEHLILTSVVAPSIVRHVAADGWMFVPALGEDTKRLLAEHWRPIIGDGALGITAHCEWNPSDFAPWWWIPTVDGLKKRCRALGFTIVDESPFWDGNAHTLLLQP